MRNEFTAIIEQDGDWYIGYCADIPGKSYPCFLWNVSDRFLSQDRKEWAENAGHG